MNIEKMMKDALEMKGLTGSKALAQQVLKLVIEIEKMGAVQRLLIAEVAVNRIRVRVLEGERVPKKEIDQVMEELAAATARVKEVLSKPSDDR